MKLIAVILITLLSAAIFNCGKSFKSWKEAENTDYNTDSLIYDSEDFYAFRRAETVIVTFQIGEFDPLEIAKQVHGVVQITGHKVWIDSAYYNLPALKDYFSEFTHRRQR